MILCGLEAIGLSCMKTNATPTEITRASKVVSRFRTMFGDTPRIYRAPGRVNLIGEHTDYNDGLVLPAAINYSCLVAIAPRADRSFIIHSEHFNQSVAFNLDEPLHRAASWSDYPVGVCWALLEAGVDLQGANVLLSTDVPLGAGLSSSAAVEVSIGYALLSVCNVLIDRNHLALLCQHAENDFVGARCGIMDQFVSCYGEADHAIVLDCRTLAHRAIRIPPALKLVVCNTMVRHSLAVGEYNSRRIECEDSVRRLAAAIPDIRALRDVSLAQLNQHRDLLTPVLYRRSRHVITENDRVLKFASALEAGDFGKIKNFMADSHVSLRDDYQVSCKELDVMVDIAMRQPGLHGARMTGGGFGGCTINLVDGSQAAKFKSLVAEQYIASTGISPEIYICSASQGASELDETSFIELGA